MFTAEQGMCRLTIEPGRIDARQVRLPTKMDTLETLRFARQLQEAASQSRHLVADASAVEEIGLAGVQLLALISAGLTRAGGMLVLETPSPAARSRIADTGFDALLLGTSTEAAPNAPLVTHRLRFTDAALDYGREPADALQQLRAMGIGVAPVLPDPLPPIGSIEADRMWVGFDMALPGEDMAALTEALAEFGGDALIDADTPPPPLIATAKTRPQPPAEVPVDTQRLKIERLMGDVEELLSRYAAIEARAASFDRDLATDFKAMGNALRGLQDHAMAAALMPIGVLMQQNLASAIAAIPAFRGRDIEIEPAVIEPLLPLLVSALEASRSDAACLSVRDAEGAVLIDIPWRVGEAMPDGLDTAAASVRGRAAITSGEEGPLLRLELPRSRSTMEALIVRAGNQLGALPVDRTIEILRPDPADVASIGGDTQLMRFRGTYLPIIDLGEALGEPAPRVAADAAVVVVMQSAAGDFGISVREVTDHRQIMVKPLGEGLPAAAGVIGFSFSAGGIALVLDVDALRSAAIGGASGAAARA